VFKKKANIKNNSNQLYCVRMVHGDTKVERTDIACIQKLPGHDDIKTTLSYTHVSKKDIGKIEGPLDRIMRKNAK